MSVPIEPIGSSPASAIGSRKNCEIFLGVAEGLLAIEQGGDIVRQWRGCSSGTIGQFFQLVLRRLQPFVVGLGIGELSP